jgi:hypothetical protein
MQFASVCCPLTMHVQYGFPSRLRPSGGVAFGYLIDRPIYKSFGITSRPRLQDRRTVKPYIAPPSLSTHEELWTKISYYIMLRYIANLDITPLSIYRHKLLWTNRGAIWERFISIFRSGQCEGRIPKLIFCVCAQNGLLKVEAEDGDILSFEAIKFGVNIHVSSCVIFRAEHLKMQALGFNEILVPVYQITRHHITEESNLDYQRCDKLTTHVCLNQTGNILQVTEGISVSFVKAQHRARLVWGLGWGYVSRNCCL